ncbi:hypothetical protein ABZ863_24785 [Saccharomonospora sp. NPDC046836]|uniref:hypothetical protein n=1 Tax=Saccharomonospora sp. NPDC046836 TaxID=3156921 RepID=UPI0033F4E631
MGKKHRAAADPRATVRKLIKSGKLKKKCCKSSPRCRKCPVLALKKAKADLPRAT